MAWRTQDDTENVLLARARWLRETTGAKNLCMAGGVALNCVANGRVAREAGFDNVWIQPAAGDDGIAIGCAYYGWLEVLKQRRGFVMDSDDHLYVIDFTKGALTPDKPADWVPSIDVIISNGDAKVIDKQVMYSRETKGWRAFFKLDVPEKTNLVEMTCDLKDGDKAISERWMYQWRR